MSSESSYWNRRTYCLVTGASRGIGKQIAMQIATKVLPGSTIVIIARSEENLQKAKKEIESSVSQINVYTVSKDLKVPDPESYLKIIQDSLHEFHTTATDYDHAMIFHNADNVTGGEGLVEKYENVALMTSYYTFNVISPIVLNTQFLKVFTKKAVAVRTIVQLTSPGANLGLPFIGLYSMSKSARDRVFQSLANECAIKAESTGESENHMRILSYAPGIVDTELLRSGLKPGSNKMINIIYKTAYDLGLAISPQKSVEKLLDILQEDKYYSGQHVDPQSSTYLKCLNELYERFGLKEDSVLRKATEASFKHDILSKM